ncbi:MAG: hypothetical protein E7119_04670 [Bacteroidales bacterium]|nr:hypothetical protein [Bacteroidales bacterium]
MKQWMRYLLIFLALLPILILRDFTPDNELKYLSIADEAIANGNIFAFFNHGVPYADKPPLYLWAIMLGKVLFGKHLMFFISLLSVIPAFITLWVMGNWCQRYLSRSKTINAELMLVTSIYFIAPIIVLRMDMLMTMFITLSLYTFYRMYMYNHVTEGSGKRSGSNCIPESRRYARWRWLLPLYIFMALFTKGPIGILMPLLSITLFLAVSGEIRSIGKYLGWRCWLLLGTLSAAWFTCVYLDGGADYLNNLLFNQTVNRAVDAFHHKKPFYFYGVSYWFSLAPWSLLAFATILLGFTKKLINTTLLKFFTVIVASTVIMLSMISSKLEIYMLPCFPFIIYGTAILLPQLKNNKWVKISVMVPAIIFIIAFAGSIVAVRVLDNISLPDIVHNLWAPIEFYTAILGAGGICALYFVLKRKSIENGINSIAISMLLLVFAFSFSIPKINHIIGLKEGCRRAMEVAAEKKINNYAYYQFKTGDNLDVYLGKQVRLLDGEELEGLKGTMLFVKKKYIARDTLLGNAVTGKENQIMEYGEYAIIPFE